MIREGTGIYAKIECYKTECRSISVTAHSVNISTDTLKSINICCFEHFLLCFLDMLHVNMVWRILCVHHRNFACISKQKKVKIKYYNHNSLKAHALNEGYSFGTSNHVKNECTYFTCLISPWRQADRFGIKVSDWGWHFIFYMMRLPWSASLIQFQINTVVTCESLMKYWVDLNEVNIVIYWKCERMKWVFIGLCTYEKLSKEGY